MHNRCRGTGKRVAQVAVITPLAVLAMSLVGTPAFAAGQGATNAATHANGGVGNDVGNGNAKHDASTTVDTSTVDTSTTTSTDSTATSHVTAGTAGTSGDPTQPQPLSNADKNSGGANGKCPGGPYCSTRDGSPSGNGNGKGKAVGKPCAGCVGKADNKNPKGQNPNGSDHNAGYECDRNHGIGRTNPAHTGCQPGGGGCTTDCGGGCTTDCGGGCTTDCGGGSDCTTNPDAAGCSNGNPGCVPTSANNFCSSVLGEKKTRVLGEKATRSLPFTGMELTPMLGAAALALSAGAGLVLAGRRRQAA